MSRATRSLLCRSPLLPGESLPSLLMRLLRKNCYRSLTMIGRLCRERLTFSDRVTQPTEAKTYQVLTELIGIDADELYAASVHHFAATIMPPTHNRRSIVLPSGQIVPVSCDMFLCAHTWPESDVQFCPLCLKESTYHRASWMPLAASVCLVHRCLLVRGCPDCQANIKIQNILDTICPNCGCELTDVSVIDVSADEFGLFSQMVIQSWLGISIQTNTTKRCSLPNQPPAVLYRVLDGLRRAVMGVKYSWEYLHQTPGRTDSSLFPCMSKRDITPTKSYILYTTAFKGLINWPRGFYDFLDAYQLRDGRELNGRIYKDFGHIYVPWLEKNWKSPAFQFIQDAFDQYLLDNYTVTPSLLRLRRIRHSPTFKARFPCIT